LTLWIIALQFTVAEVIKIHFFDFGNIAVFVSQSRGCAEMFVQRVFKGGEKKPLRMRRAALNAC
jgi:hypothetical protein